MDDGIKQRLIGAVVLVALMVIFLPMLLSSDELEPEEVLVDIPERPVVPSFEITAPVKSIEQKDTQTAVDQPEVDQKHTLQQLVDKEVDDKKLPVSWTLQVASFKDRKNAEKLRDTLRQSGYKAYMKYRLDVEPKMVRVMVGPVLERKEIDKIKAAISSQHKLDGVVVRYLP